MRETNPDGGDCVRATVWGLRVRTSQGGAVARARSASGVPVGADSRVDNLRLYLLIR